MPDERRDTGLLENEEVLDQVIEPPLYRVLLLNDDYTTMEFVVEVLQSIFKKTASEATKIMLMVHKQGSGECGCYTREIAETKMMTVHNLAKEKGYPLRCRLEEVG